MNNAKITNDRSTEGAANNGHDMMVTKVLPVTRIDTF